GNSQIGDIGDRRGLLVHARFISVVFEKIRDQLAGDPVWAMRRMMKPRDSHAAHRLESGICDHGNHGKRAVEVAGLLHAPERGFEAGFGHADGSWGARHLQYSEGSSKVVTLRS